MRDSLLAGQLWALTQGSTHESGRKRALRHVPWLRTAPRPALHKELQRRGGCRGDATSKPEHLTRPSPAGRSLCVLCCASLPRLSPLECTHAQRRLLRRRWHPPWGTDARPSCDRAPVSDQLRLELLHLCSEIPPSLTRGPPCGWGLGRAYSVYDSGANACWSPPPPRGEEWAAPVQPPKLSCPQFAFLPQTEEG